MNSTKLLIVLVVLILLGVGGFFAYQSGILSDLSGRLLSNTPPNESVKPSSYSAIFLSNGQVYFGVVGNLNSQYPVISDVFYLRTSQKLTPGEANKADTVSVEKAKKTASGSAVLAPETPALVPGAATATDELTLIKLGGELHGPTDQIQVNRDHILFIEALRNDSKVVKAILDYQQKTKGQ